MRSRNDRDQLFRVIGSVRRRWRFRLFLRGAAIVLGAGLLVFLVSAYGMDRLRFSPTAVLAFRGLAYATLAVLVVKFLVMALARRVSDERVALYLEEHEPSLEARLLSAVEFADTEMTSSEAFSPLLVERLVENAVEECAAIENGRRVEARPLARSSGMLAGTTLAALAIVLLSPSFLRHSAPYLLPFSDASPENPYRIGVAPGNALVARGGELRITAKLFNFDSDAVDIAVQRGVEGEWERFPMGLDEESGGYLFFIFDLEEQTEYFVEAGGVRSSLFRIDVAELPYVGQLSLEYHFPAYTGLSPRRQEDGGDIAALQGTEVRLFVSPTVPVAGGAIAVEDQDTLPLTLAADGTLAGSLQVARDGLYRIVFESREGDLVVGSPDYLIDVLSDQPPYVAFAKPGRDVTVTNIDEVFVEVEAEDDYGVGSVQLVYSLNGGPEKTLALYNGRRREVTAAHTFYLEELSLVPGDFISYYARARDENRVSGRQVTTTDIYFMEIRPFDREYRQAQQRGAPGGGGGEFDNSLSQRQRDIIAATFKMVRDREEYPAEEYDENLATLVLAQGRLREQVDRLVARLEARGIVEMDPRFETVAEALPKAAEAMREAEERLGEREPDDALSPEQRALQQLQRAEAAFREVQVGRGGQSGGGQADAEELADLFELELDKQRNQYESVQRNRRQQVEEQIDETLQKLQELARRQQQENERLRAQANQSQGQGGSGSSQRQLAEEAEELARKLERLAREESRPELNQTARELQQAAEQMRRAAADARNGDVAEGLSALERLKEARRLLDENRSAGLERDVEDALRRAERLAGEQRDVVRDVERLAEGGDQGERLQRLMERKEEMAGEVKDIEAQLDRLARESRREQRDASRKLQEAANSIRDAKLEDKIRYSRGVVQQRSSEYAQNFEQQIERDIEGLRERIEAARAAIGETKEQRLARSLDRTRDLVRSLESVQERMEQQAQSGDQQAQGGEQQGQAEDGQPSSAQRASGEQRGEAQADESDSSAGAPRLRSGDARQFRREFGERRGEAERLRESLQREGIDTRDLDQIITDLRQLERDRPYGDPRGLAELQAEVIRSLKEFEYALRREIGGGEARRLLLSGSDEVPPGYRALVEEYYKALAEQDSR